MGDRGRYRARSGERRDRKVGLRVSAAELDELAAAAEPTRMSVAGWTVEAALSVARRAPAPEADHLGNVARELVLMRLALNRVGVNLNQIARQVNTNGVVPAALDGIIRQCQEAIGNVDTAVDTATRKRP